MAATTFLGNLAGRVGVITGASTGIGAATAVAFAREGVCLSLHGRNVERLEQVKQQCVDQGLTKDDVLLVGGDLTKTSDIQQLAKATLDKFGTVSMLVNNAGFIYATGVMTATPEQMNHLFQLHVLAPMQITQLLAPELIKNKGSIVNMSSVCGMMGIPAMNAYGISKAGMNHLTKALNSELGPQGVRVNSFCSGVVSTECMNNCGITSTADQTKQMQDMIAQGSILKRVSTVEEAARMILFLASDACPFMIGQNVVVDGGMMDSTLASQPPPQQ